LIELSKQSSESIARRRKLVGRFVLASIIVVGLYSCTTDEFSHKAFFNSSGALKGGKAFQVQIGMSEKEAIDKLRSQSWQLVEIFEGKSCQQLKYDKGTQFYVFYKQTWTQGAICLVTKDQSVSAMAWSVSLIAI